MPIINVTIAQGRSVEKRQKLIRALTHAAIDAFDVRPEQVRVILNEVPLENFAVAGVSFAERAASAEVDV